MAAAAASEKMMVPSFERRRPARRPRQWCSGPGPAARLVVLSARGPGILWLRAPVAEQPVDAHDDAVRGSRRVNNRHAGAEASETLTAKGSGSTHNASRSKIQHHGVGEHEDAISDSWY